MALSNQSLVYDILKDGSKLTVTEVHLAVSVIQKAKGQHPMNERTIRRCLQTLTDEGHLKEFGRTPTNATLYGRVDVGIEASHTLVNFGGNLVNVKTFAQLMTDPDGHPFTLNPKAQIISTEMEAKLRSILLYVAISAGSSGQEEKLKTTIDALGKLLNEAEHLVSVLKNFIDSPIWYEHYRDAIAVGVRDLQKEDPELFQLAIDVIKGG